ncbi:MAG: InlB B-repeat-containing protein [Coriobacteriia bacterium]|nr:InlB B-repeat-containing protein [Coriobacteriia bacterium]
MAKVKIKKIMTLFIVSILACFAMLVCNANKSYADNYDENLTISGHCYDSVDNSIQPLPCCLIELVTENGDQVDSTKTDNEGFYKFSNYYESSEKFIVRAKQNTEKEYGIITSDCFCWNCNITKDLYFASMITYNSNMADSGIAPNAEIFKTGERIVAYNYRDLKKNGYIFNGWNTACDGSGQHYEEGQKFLCYNNITLYAEWVNIDSVKSLTKDGHKYWPVFDGDQGIEGVKFFDEKFNRVNVTDMTSIKVLGVTHYYAIDKVKFTVVRSINNVSFVDVYNKGKGCCSPDKAWASSNLLAGENVVSWGGDCCKDAEVASVPILKIWNAYKEGWEGFGSLHGFFWSNCEFGTEVDECQNRAVFWMCDGVLHDQGWAAVPKFSHLAHDSGCVCIARTFD